MYYTQTDTISKLTVATLIAAVVSVGIFFTTPKAHAAEIDSATYVSLKAQLTELQKLVAEVTSTDTTYLSINTVVANNTPNRGDGVFYTGDEVILQWNVKLSEYTNPKNELKTSKLDSCSLKFDGKDADPTKKGDLAFYFKSNVSSNSTYYTITCTGERPNGDKGDPIVKKGKITVTASPTVTTGNTPNTIVTPDPDITSGDAATQGKTPELKFSSTNTTPNKDGRTTVEYEAKNVKSCTIERFSAGTTNPIPNSKTLKLAVVKGFAKGSTIIGPIKQNEQVVLTCTNAKGTPSTKTISISPKTGKVAPITGGDGCIFTAILNRNTAIHDAWYNLTTPGYAQKIDAALTKRNNAIQEAYGLTADITSKINAAHSTFAQEKSAAEKAFNKARNTAIAEYKIAKSSCPASTTVINDQEGDANLGVTK